MIRRILPSLFVLIPVIVLFSGMAMTPLLGIFAVLILFALPADMRKNPALSYPRYAAFLKWLALLLVMPLIGSLWSITPALSFSTAARVTFLCALGAAAFIYIPALATRREKFVAGYTISIIVVSLLVLQEALLGGGLIQYIYTHTGIRYDRFMTKNINRGLCALTVLIWPLMLAYYEDGKARKGWLLFALLACALMIMHSLSAKVGLVAGVLAFFSFRRFPVFLPRAVCILFPLFLLLFPVLYMVLEKTLFAQPFVLQHLTESGVHRLHIWHILLEQVAQKPWLGWGIDTTRAMPLTAQQLLAINLQTPPLHPHSPSMQLLLEEGIIGFLMSIAAIALLLREWVRMPLSNPVQRATAGALIVSYVATGVSSFGIWQHWWIATFCMSGMLWRYIAHSKNQVTV